MGVEPSPKAQTGYQPHPSCGTFNLIRSKKMREIKFRIWSNRYKDWFYYSIKNDLKLDNEASLDFSKLGQFTGLLDINHKEIYEGDICKNYWEVSYSDEDGAFGFYNKEGIFILLREKELEVIGNVWENPELKEAK